MNAALGACAGVRVIEFATMVSGPYGGQMLGDLGADVIKVEPIAGDPLRAIRPSLGGASGMFLQFNRNKRSIAVNLKTAEGREVAERLIASADVVIENNRNGAMSKLGLGYEQMAEVNPRLIYMSVSGFGDSGPYADRLAYEHLLQAMSGVMLAQGQGEVPVGIQNVVVDKSSALLGANAILAALYHRERTGAGQRLTISLLSAVAAFLLPELLGRETFVEGEVEPGATGGTFFPVQTRDGHVLGYLQQRSHFVALCQTFSREDLIDDPRFQDAWGIFSNLSLIWDLMRDNARRMSSEEATEAAATYGVALATINDLVDFIEDRQVRHAGIFSEVADPELGLVRQIGPAVSFEKTPAAIRTLAPRLGQHSTEILNELGFDHGQRDAFFAARAVA